MATPINIPLDKKKPPIVTIHGLVNIRSLGTLRPQSKVKQRELETNIDNDDDILLASCLRGRS